MATLAETATRRRASRLLVALWAAVALLAVGIAYDAWWHANNPTVIKTAAEQAAVHWVVWVGLAALLAVGLAGARALPTSWRRGYGLLLVTVVAHVAVEGWHFYEHYTLRDLDVVHSVIKVAHVAVLGGALAATDATRRAMANGRGV
jgi:hypothetical protein